MPDNTELDARDDRGTNGVAARTDRPGSVRATLMERLAHAVDRISDSVDEQQLREAMAAPTDMALFDALGHLTSTLSVSSVVPDPLASARARGERGKHEILASPGHMLTTSEAAARLETTIADVEQRERDGLLLALPIDTGELRYPAWQFTDSGLLPGLEDVLRNMGVRSSWMRAAFFLSGDLRLDGQTPLEMLRQGRIEAVTMAGQPVFSQPCLSAR